MPTYEKYASGSAASLKNPGCGGLIFDGGENARGAVLFAFIER